MGAIMTTDPSEASDLLRRAGQGDAQALGQLLFVTPHVIEMVYLVLLGLGRVFGEDRE
jgi:hypothetical protein